MKKVLQTLIMALAVFAFAGSASALNGELYGGGYFDNDIIEYNTQKDFFLGANISEDYVIFKGWGLKPYAEIEGAYAKTDNRFENYMVGLGFITGFTDRVYMDTKFEYWDDMSKLNDEVIDIENETRYMLKLGYKWSL